jgi:prepilin peptidase CpaA
VNGVIVLLLAVLGWAGTLTWSDFKSRLLPNWLTVGGAAVALLIRFGLGGWPLLIDGFAAACVAGGVLLIPFILNGAGGGDVKMLFAAGAIAGWTKLLMLLWTTSVVGVVMGVVMLLSGQLNGARLRHGVRTLVDWRYDRAAGAAGLPSKDSTHVRIPFSLPISVGLIVALLW